MNFVRQRLATILLVIGLILAWICLTAVVIRQTLLLSAKIPSYATTALKNPTVRSAVSDLIVKSVKHSYPVLSQIPTAQLNTAVDRALTQPAVAYEFANVTLQIQQHFIGLSNQQIVLGGPALSTAVAQIISPNNPTQRQLIEKIPFTYAISTSSIPSIGKYFQWIGNLISVSAYSGAVLLVSAIAVSAKKNRTLRKIGIAFIMFSAFEVAVFWLLPKYVLSHFHSGPEVVVSGIMAAAGSAIVPIYVGVLGAGIAFTAVSLLI
ncbi:MAG: hypothetical protein M0Z96_08090 [Actinomycetota bacterium]|nr:hypothetical protein [Actinomycetota bacterium]